MYRHNCHNHLYYVNNIEKVHVGVCLYCGKMLYFNDCNNFDKFPIDTIYHDKIDSKYHIKYDYNILHKIVMEIIKYKPSLTNYEVLINLQISLYKMLEKDYLKKIKNNKIPLMEIYYRSKINDVQKDLEELLREKDEHENKMTNSKKI